MFGYCFQVARRKIIQVIHARWFKIITKAVRPGVIVTAFTVATSTFTHFTKSIIIVVMVTIKSTTQTYPLKQKLTSQCTHSQTKKQGKYFGHVGN